MPSKLIVEIGDSHGIRISGGEEGGKMSGRDVLIAASSFMRSAGMVIDEAISQHGENKSASEPAKGLITGLELALMIPTKDSDALLVGLLDMLAKVVGEKAGIKIHSTTLNKTKKGDQNDHHHCPCNGHR